MKKTEKYICIFCVVLGFAVAYVIGYRYGKDEDNNNVRLKDEVASDMPYISEGITMGQDSTKDASSSNTVLKEDAKMVLETCFEENQFEIETSELNLPVELIGFDREKVIQYLENNGDFFVNDDEELINIMLVSFAEDRVVIRKNVRQGAVIIYPNGESERYNYYIGFKEDKIVVYKKDKETVFIETGITYDMVDRETREKIEEGVWIENINTLYRYLESITS